MLEIDSSQKGVKFISKNHNIEANNSNTFQNLIKTVKKQSGEKLVKLNNEFDKIQTDFLNQLQKTSLICAHENLTSDKDGSQSDNTVLGIARQINILVSYLVGLTRYNKNLYI